MKYLILGKLYEPVKCGDEGDWYVDDTDESTMCGDCGCGLGEQHYKSCDIERCPACGMQLITCDCHPIYEVPEEYENNKDHMQKLIKLQQLKRIELEKEFVKLASGKKQEPEQE